MASTRPVADRPWRATGFEQPVFSDPGGRRGRIVRLAGAALGAAATAGLALLLTGSLGFSKIPSLASLRRPALPHLVGARHRLVPVNRLGAARVQVARFAVAAGQSDRIVIRAAAR